MKNQKPIYRIWNHTTEKYLQITNSGKSTWTQKNRVIKVCQYEFKYKNYAPEIHVLDINEGNQKLSLREFIEYTKR